MTRVTLLVAGVLLSVASACGSDGGAGPSTTATDDGAAVVSDVGNLPGGQTATTQFVAPTTAAGPPSATLQPGDATSSTRDFAPPATTDPAAGPTTLRLSPTTSSATTIFVTTLPTTVPPTTTIPITAPPSTVGAPICSLDVVIQHTETAFEDLTPGNLHCAGAWAAWSGTPADPLLANGYFAVAEWIGSVWQLRNLGMTLVCTDGGVPAELWAALQCVD